MSRSFVIINTPSTCEQCQLFCYDGDGYWGACAPLNRGDCIESGGKNGRPEWCPLKPWPEKKDVGFSSGAPGHELEATTQDSYDRLFNQILGEIEGGTAK